MVKLMTVILAGLLAVPLLASCDSPKNRKANCITWSGNAYAVAQLRDIEKTEREATETWMKIVKHMSAGVAKKMREEIAWVYANPKISQGQVEVERYKACMAGNWPEFK